MSEVTRTPFVFIGKKAEQSAKYYDTVLSHGYQGELIALAWEAAHKFGAQFMAAGVVSFRHGLIYGEKAREAADYYNEKWGTKFSNCPETGRRASMRSFSRELLKETENMFDVHVFVKDNFYY